MKNKTNVLNELFGRLSQGAATATAKPCHGGAGMGSTSLFGDAPRQDQFFYFVSVENGAHLN